MAERRPHLHPAQCYHLHSHRRRYDNPQLKVRPWWRPWHSQGQQVLAILQLSCLLLHLLMHSSSRQGKFMICVVRVRLRQCDA
jgi:hypothetical protein